MEIQILSPDVVDQIAAGEVVERPSHMVKELVENSLDAGASEIEITFDQGGRFVKVTDNGKGIGPEDLSRALDRFATSKISLSSDLWKLKTFGFRGEALASISAVSKLTLRSRPHQQELGAQIVSEFGHRSQVDPVGATPGTMVQVEELFTNTPVRLKFLKSEASEGTQIKTTVKALALANPQVQFKVFQGRELVHFWPKAATRKARVEQILEIDKMYEGDAQREGVRAHAVFADPNKTAKSARNIWLFVQNRWVQDRGLQAAVQEAYRSLLMHGEYPIAAVWVECDPEFVDVNVHPTKSQVKFQDASLAFRAVQASLRDSLEQAPWVSDVLAGVQGPSTSGQHFGWVNKAAVAPPPSSLRFEDQAFEATQFNKKEMPLFDGKSSLLQTMATLKQSSAVQIPQTHSQSESSEGAPRDSIAPIAQMPPVAVKAQPFVKAYHGKAESLASMQKKWSSLEVLGQANLTYIICQSPEGLMFVDQHAAHERVAFERLMAAWKGGKIEIQDYLFPVSVDLSPEKVEALTTYFADIQKLGVHLETLGPSSVGIKAAPGMIKEAAVAGLLDELAQDILDNGGSFRLEKKIGDICATMACHSVVRAGQALSLEQMRALLQEMDQFPLSTFCPHGRPVFVEYPYAKLEKDFGRIV